MTAIRALLCFMLLLPTCVIAQEEYSVVLNEQRGAVATVNPIATNAAVEAFAKGGNAIDAALAAAFTLGVVDSHNSGIGGGCFILVRRPDGSIEAIDGREMAPAAAERDMYVIDGEHRPELSKTGALAVGVPGSVGAFYHLQRVGGKLTWADVILPAAEIAEKGFPIDATLANRLQRTADTLRRFPSTAAIFLDGQGEPWPRGHTLQQKDLANSYRALAEEGPAWFYGGEFAHKVERWMTKNGGIVTAEDFANYQVRKRKPLVSQYEGYTIYGFPPPSSGGVHVAQILNILDHFAMEQLAPADRYHVLAEAMKLAFADRAHWLGDSDFVDVPVKGLMSQHYARELADIIQMDAAAVDVDHGEPPSRALLDKHTTHIATADADGNWVAITTTLNTSFGSKVTVPGTGVLLNNQMDDFAAQPGEPNAFGLVGAEANAIAPGKRPLSSMSPTIVVNKQGEPAITVGAAGGPTIISQVLQALVYSLGFGKELEDAIATPRVHHQWKPEILFVERVIDDAVQEALEEKGHRIEDLGAFGATQAIGIRTGEFEAVTEPRLRTRSAE